ncbi:non-specific serine/threonine protein kinase [Plasmodiophora brassicae]
MPKEQRRPSPNHPAAPAPASDEQRTQSKAGKYKKLGKLGEGAFGTTFLVQKTDPSDVNTYVMKEVRCRDKDQLIEALREMVALRILQCPWVVRYEDYWTEGLNVVLVMEHCPGGDLYREMNTALKKRQRLPEEKIMLWFTQITLGLHAIHSRSFMHRDIKPSNVFLDIHGNAKLGDFGLSSNIGGLSLDQSYRGTICGTPGFLSPELQRGEKYNATSDVWALGCTLYELLLLRSAYQDTLESVFPQAVPPEYSSEVKDLLQLLLTEDLHKRPQTEDILKIGIVARYAERITGTSYKPADATEVTGRPNTPVVDDVERQWSPLDLRVLAANVRSLNFAAVHADLTRHPTIVAFVAIVFWMLLKLMRIL